MRSSLSNTVPIHRCAVRSRQSCYYIAIDHERGLDERLYRYRGRETLKLYLMYTLWRTAGWFHNFRGFLPARHWRQCYFVANNLRNDIIWQSSCQSELSHCLCMYRRLLGSRVSRDCSQKKSEHDRNETKCALLKKSCSCYSSNTLPDCRNK